MICFPILPLVIIFSIPEQKSYENIKFLLEEPLPCKVNFFLFSIQLINFGINL